jgi:hypothetical protein
MTQQNQYQELKKRFMLILALLRPLPTLLMLVVLPLGQLDLLGLNKELLVLLMVVLQLLLNQRLNQLVKLV